MVLYRVKAATLHLEHPGGFRMDRCGFRNLDKNII